jgi:hypothetical protein
LLGEVVWLKWKKLLTCKERKRRKLEIVKIVGEVLRRFEGEGRKISFFNFSATYFNEAQRFVLEVSWRKLVV